MESGDIFPPKTVEFGRTADDSIEVFRKQRQSTRQLRRFRRVAGQATACSERKVENYFHFKPQDSSRWI
jgi:hypothetical protein